MVALVVHFVRVVVGAGCMKRVVGKAVCAFLRPRSGRRGCMAVCVPVGAAPIPTRPQPAPLLCRGAWYCISGPKLKNMEGQSSRE